MNRKGSIAVAAATAGILIAGATASVAVFSASQAVPEPEAITLVVADTEVGLDPIAAAPTFEPVPLPEIVITSTVPKAASSISEATAKSLVLAEVPGTLVSVAKATRGGFPSYAVTVKRADGSTVTGYVDQADGVIHDWTQTAAPAPAYNDDDDKGEEEEEEDDDESEHEGSDHDGDDD
jgi:hypothetical protein